MPATKELPPALKRVHFTSTIRYWDNGTVYRPKNDVEYVGPPSPEIDKAWDDLMGGM